uniref:Beta-2-glycoprotein 1 n=1 Tax=Stegastes partitus TaxID=144197 RepID=A0A3B5BN51_9TELE
SLCIFLCAQLSLYSAKCKSFPVGQIKCISLYPVCGRPPVTDGIDDTTLKRVYEIGEVVILACGQGYLPSTAASSRIICSDTGEWTQLNLACSPKMCPIPRPLQPLAMGRTEAPFKSVLNFTYVMLGANESRCLHDGTWSNPPPVLSIYTFFFFFLHSPFIGHTKHPSKTVALNASYNFPLDSFFFLNCSCYRGIIPLLHLIPEVSCSIPTNIPNGVITFAVMRPHGYKEKVKYACNEHYVLDGEAEIQCQNTGNWSSKPVCRAPCTVGIKRGRIFYNAKKLWIADLKPNRVFHGEHVAFYCLNRDERCGYPVVSTCNDGSLPIPECFEEPGKVEYSLRAKTLPSEITMCASSPPASTTSSTRPA